MDEPRWLDLSDDEIDTFLGRGGTGVLSFATEAGGPPTSIPVSYGYNEDAGTLYFRLSVPPRSEKSDLVDHAVSFVIHRETDDGWRSVVATGRLRATEETSYASSTVQGMWGIEIPRIDIFERPSEELTFREYYLVPETLSGRAERPAGP